MERIFSLFNKANKPSSKSLIVEVLSFFVNVLVFMIIVVLLLFGFTKAYTLFGMAEAEHFIHDMVFMLVLVKIYRLLISFLQHHHISVKYIVEISIIAPAIEIVFAFDKYEVPILLMLGAFGLANLWIYILYHDKLLEIDKAS